MAGSIQVVAHSAELALLGMAPPVGSAEDLAILPSLILFLTAGAVLSVDLIRVRRQRHRPGPWPPAPEISGSAATADPLLFMALLGLVSAAAALGAAAAAPAIAAAQFRGTIVTDGLAAGSGILLLLMTGAVLAVAGSARHEPHGRGDLYFLVLLGSGFLVLCVQAAGLLTAFVSVEALGLTILALASLGSGSAEAKRGTLRLFLLSESASAVLLLGLALVFGATGETSFAALADRAPGASTSSDAPLLAVGAALVFAALGARCLALPIAFRWLRHLIDGDSLLATQLSRAAQIAIVVLIVRAGLSLAGALNTAALVGVLSAVAAGALVLGAVMIGVERRPSKPRDAVGLLRAATVFHLGFLLMAVVVELAGARGGTMVDRGVPLLFYLFVTEVPMLGVVTWAATRGAFLPNTALWFAVPLLSFAGLPPLPGFWGRLILFREAIATGFGFLALFAAAASVVAIHYAVRDAAALLREARSRAAIAGPDAGAASPPPEAEPRWVARLVLATCAIVTLVLGLFPETLLEVCRAWALG